MAKKSQGSARKPYKIKVTSKSYPKVDAKEIAKALGAELITDVSERLEFEKKHCLPNPMDANAVIWANLVLHADLIEMFIKAFPVGIVMFSASDQPSLRIDSSYTMTELGVRRLLGEYNK